jgi:DNA polymerase III subunit gamma/tau
MAASTYQVFARKYRPQKFSEVVGQDHVTQTLSNAIKHGRIAQAYLFVGPRGTGKTSMARILSKALNAPQGPRIDFDDQDEVCIEISEGRSLDVLEIDGASNNGVEQVRELRDKVRYAPVKGKYKIYYIDEVHMLSDAAFNALLKTLEEPPAHVKFVFATTEVHKLPATILSRCQRFDLRRIPDLLIANHLQKICDLEKIKAEPAALQAISRYAEGGMRDAEVALDQAVSFYGNEVKEDHVLQMFGLSGIEPVAHLVETLIQGNPELAIRRGRELISAGKDLSRLTQDLIRFVRNLTIYQISPVIIQGELTSKEESILKELASQISSGALHQLIEELTQLENRLRFGSAKDVLFEVALIQMSRLREKVSLEAILSRLGSASPLPPSSPAPVMTPTSSPNSSSTPASVVKHQEESSAIQEKKSIPLQTPTPTAMSPVHAWKKAVERFSQERPMEAATIQATQFVGMRGETLEIALPDRLKSKIPYLQGARNLALLEETVQEHVGKKVKLVIITMDSKEMPQPVSSSEPPLKPFQDADFTSDPLIKQALELFKATVVGTGKIEA